jgi:hypothetical protein
VLVFLALSSCAPRACSDEEDRRLGRWVEVLVGEPGPRADAAEESLVQSGREAVLYLETGLYDAEPRARRRVVKTLARIGDRSALPILDHLARRPGRVGNARAARAAPEGHRHLTGRGNACTSRTPQRCPYNSPQSRRASWRRFASAHPTAQPVVLAALHWRRRNTVTCATRSSTGRHHQRPAHVFVATFYTMFRLEAGRREHAQGLHQFPDKLRGGYAVLRALSASSARAGAVEPDSRWSRRSASRCAPPPAVVCGTEYFLDVTPERVPSIVATLKANPHPEGEVA